MESKTTEAGQEPYAPEDLPSGETEPESPPETDALKAENEGFWKAVERYAPQIVDILSENEDTELLAAVARRLSNRPDADTHAQRTNSKGKDPVQELAGEMARYVVDSLLGPQPSPISESRDHHEAGDRREAERIEELARQEAIRRGTVERGSAERREPAITLGPKAKEVAQAFGIPEDKLARAAAERLRRKGVLRP